MSQKKFSQFNIIAIPTNSDYLAGFRDSEDPEIENTNFIIKIEDIQKALTEASISGESLISDNENLKLKKLEEGFAIKLESTGDKIEVSVDEDQLDLSNIQGVISLAKGGLGVSLDEPTDPGFLMSTGSEIAFINLGPGFSINGNELNFTPSSVLTNKGDLLTRNNSSLIRLPAGLNNRVLKTNSSTASGLEWAEESESNKVRPYEESEVSDYLYDLIDLSPELNKQKLNDKVLITLDQESLDLSLMNNESSNFSSEADSYDSGWINVRAYEDPMLPGLFSASNTPNPLRFRIIGHKCFLQGNVYVPLFDNESSSVITDHNDIPITKDTQVATGALTGIEYWSSVSDKGLVFPAFLPDSLSLSQIYNSGVKFSGRRDVAFLDGDDQFIINSGTPVGKRATFPISDIVINTDRTMIIKSVFDFDSININGYLQTPTSGREMNELYRISSSFKEGDSAISFEDYANSFNDTLTENRDVTKKYIHETYANLKYPFDFNGGNATKWGGAFIYLNEVLTLNEALSLNNIETAVNNYA